MKTTKKIAEATTFDGVSNGFESDQSDAYWTEIEDGEASDPALRHLTVRQHGMRYVVWYKGDKPNNTQLTAYLRAEGVIDRDDNVKAEASARTKAADILALLPQTTEASGGSKKVDSMLAWGDSLEGEDAEKAHELVTAELWMYDLSHGLKLDDFKNIWSLAKNPQSEFYLDGELLWIADDTQAVASKLQKLARDRGLDIPRFG